MKKNWVVILTAVCVLLAACTSDSSEKPKSRAYVAVQEISFADENILVNQGDTVELSEEIIFTPKNASNKRIMWSSGNKEVATVDEDGAVVCIKAGIVTINARADDNITKRASVKIVVQPPEEPPDPNVLVSSVELTGISLSINEEKQIPSIVLPANAGNRSLDWVSANPAIATVDSNGRVTGKAEGSAAITATSKDGSNKSHTCTVTVSEASGPNVLVSGVSLTDISVFINQQKAIPVTVLPANAGNKALDWVSSNPAIAAVNASGFVTGKATGSVTITATSKDGGNKSGACTVSVSVPSSESTVNIIKAQGWLESAYVTWEDFSADKYNVYYQGGSVTQYTKIDDQLIRKYPGYFRADVLGLPAGNYNLKVHPVIGGTELGGAERAVTVEAHDRSGFAFYTPGRVPGAYNMDGSLKDNAIILYVTDKNKNSIQADIVTKDTGATTKLTGIGSILIDGVKKGVEKRPVVIRFIGFVQTGVDKADKGVDLWVEAGAPRGSGPQPGDNVYVTLEGVGDDATLGFGIRARRARNVEIRNLGFMYYGTGEGDSIGLHHNNEYMWVHNCDFFYGDLQGTGEADQDKGDGACDVRDTDFATVSYNHFYDTGKTHLGGNGGETPGYSTYHHNWYDHSDSRQPRVREHYVHVYNNYYDGIGSYSIGAAVSSTIFVENNYYRHAKKPMLISSQGSDSWNPDTKKYDTSKSGEPSMSAETGGMIKACNNFFTEQGAMDNTTRYNVVYYGTGTNQSTTQFDAYLVQNRADIVPGTVKALKGGWSYWQELDDRILSGSYRIRLDDPNANMVDKIKKYAGRIEGGDFKWEFTNADDTSTSVNSALKAKIRAYKSNLISIQGM